MDATLANRPTTATPSLTKNVTAALAVLSAFIVLPSLVGIGEGLLEERLAGRTLRPQKPGLEKTAEPKPVGLPKLDGWRR